MGQEVIVTDRVPFENFEVSEEVIIDYTSHRVTVEYSINNTSSLTESFNMLFPINAISEGIKSDCAPYGKPLENSAKFHANLNDADLEISRINHSDLIMDEEYKKFNNDNTCIYFQFNVTIIPGHNTLRISYKLLTDYSHSNFLKKSTFTYSIWPAKNWVSKFNKALWRVIHSTKKVEPKAYGDGWRMYENDRGRTIYEFDDGWSMSQKVDFPKYGYQRRWTKFSKVISGPGKRIDYDTHTDFIAIDYKPEGSINIMIKNESLDFVMQKACSRNLNKNPEPCLESFIRMRPYMGEELCYTFNDLLTVPSSKYGSLYSDTAMPYLRNEIFARKGYIFKTDQMRTFFSKMPWYKPKHVEVELNKIEKWNVQLLQEVEKYLVENKSTLYHEKGWFKYEFGLPIQKNVYEPFANTCPNK